MLFKMTARSHTKFQLGVKKRGIISYDYKENMEFTSLISFTTYKWVLVPFSLHKLSVKYVQNDELIYPPKNNI